MAAGGFIILTNMKTILESFGASGYTVLAVAVVLFVVWVSLIVSAVRQERIARATEPELESVPA